MVGSTIKVVATAENGNTFESDETEEVGVYEALEILSADQVKKDKVYVTFSAPYSLLDDITVTKGATEKAIDSIIPDDDNLGATIVMKDALAAGEYVVTLTPADEDEDPSSVTFEAMTANKAERIEILGDYLVMKDTNFQEGYCFIKGYNHFDEEVTLSGLTVTAAPSTSTQYDASTGKLTVKSAEANQYAIVKQVTVYAQTMVDSKAIVDQKTLQVSSIGYPTEVEFGEITKDATNAPDISDGITINELNSGLYYIPILSIKDNYGNDMLAKDLNDLDLKNLLTTIPTDDDSLYFSVRHEGSVFTEKNGQVVVFLDKGNNKPGTFNFLMTSAGGQFEKEVNIIENPYINTLNVTVPDIYEYEETDEFGLVGYDQNGKELDLYDYLTAGEFDEELTFNDMQNLTNSWTKINAGDTGKWRVQKFADTKTYKVTFVPDNSVKAKGMVNFIITTASFNTETKLVTVGARGTSGTISSELKGAAKTDFDFNQNLQFLDANGKKMDRAHNDKYPTFVPKNTTVIASLAKADTDKLTDEKIAEANHNDTDADDFEFYYVVSSNDKVVNGTVDERVTQDAGPNQDGKVTTAGQYYVFLIAKQGNNWANGSDTRIIDSRSFYVSKGQVGDIPVSYTAKVSNKLYTGDQYDEPVEVKVDVTYRNGVVKKDVAASGLALNGGFVVAGNKISKGSVKADGSAKVSVYLAEIYGDRNGDGVEDDGTAVGTEPYTNDGAVATCTLEYSDDDPVGTKIDFKRTTTTEALPSYGTIWKEDETETVWDLDKGVASAITVKDGELTMTNGNVALDTYKMVVKDQYGIAMKDAKYYINGEQVPTTQTEIVNATTQKVLEIKGQSKGSEVSQTWRVNVPTTTTVTAVDNSDYRGSKNVTTAKGLEVALADAGIKDIVVTDNIALANDITVAKGKTLTIAEGATVNAKAGTEKITVLGTLTVNGTLGDDTGTNGISELTIGSNAVDAEGNPVNEAKLVVNGEMYTNDAVTIHKGSNLNVPAGGIWAHDAAVTVTNNGLVDGAGHVEIANATITTTAPGTAGNGEWNVTGNTLVFKKVTFNTAAPLLGGHIKFEGAVDCSTVVPVVEGGATIDISKVTGSDAKFVVPGESSVTVVAKDGETTIEGEDKQATTVTAKNDGTVAGASAKSAPTTTALKIQSTAAQGYDFSKYYTDFAASQFAPVGEPVISADGLTTTYNYAFTGTLAYNNNLPAFGSEYPWGIAFTAQAGDATSDVYLGPNATAGTTTPIDGWVPANDSDPILAWGYTTQPSASNSDIIIKYVFTDGTTVFHVVDMSGATFGAAKETT